MATTYTNVLTTMAGVSTVGGEQPTFDAANGTSYSASAFAPSAIVQAFCCFTGLCFTTVIIVTYTLSPTLRAPHNVFMVNLAVTDMITLVTSIPPIYVILNGADGEKFYRAPYCDMYAFTLTYTGFTSMSFIAAIGFIRFICICYPKLRLTLFTWPKCVAAAICIWLYNMALVIPALTGWGRYKYSDRMYLCGYDFAYNFAYNMLLVFATYGIVCVIVFICYLKIFLVFRDSKKKVGHALQSGVAGSQKIKRDEFRLAIQCLIIFIFYNIAYGPLMMLMFVIDPHGKLDPTFYEIGLLSMYLNSTINCPLYMYFNKVFRAEVPRIWLCQKPPGAVVTSHPGTGTATRTTGPTTT